MKNFLSKQHDTINYKRLSRSTRMAYSDLVFFHGNHYIPINKLTLITGVLVGFRSTSNHRIFYSPWKTETCHHSEKDIQYMYKLINHTLEMPSEMLYDYFIMDVFGNILFSNCEITSTIDENEIIHLTSNETELNKLIYPVQFKKYKYKCFYCCASSLEDLNNSVKNLVETGLVVKPKNFKKTFSLEPSNNTNEKE